MTKRKTLSENIIEEYNKKNQAKSVETCVRAIEKDMSNSNIETPYILWITENRTVKSHKSASNIKQNISCY